MRFAIPAVLLFGTQAALAAAPPAVARGCATSISVDEVARVEAKFAEYKYSFANKTDAAKANVVPVYFHVVSKDSTLAGGNVEYVLESFPTASTLLIRWLFTIALQLSTSRLRS